MKKIVRLKESDLQRIVKRVIKESEGSMISELGGMDDGHPFSGDLNFNDLTPEERERVNKYYRFKDIESEDEDDILDYEDRAMGRMLDNMGDEWDSSFDDEHDYDDKHWNRD